MNDYLLAKFFIGSGTPIAGLLVSLSTYNQQLQAVSLLVGITVGLCTLGQMVWKWFKK